MHSSRFRVNLEPTFLKAPRQRQGIVVLNRPNAPKWDMHGHVSFSMGNLLRDKTTVVHGLLILSLSLVEQMASNCGFPLTVSAT